MFFFHCVSSATWSFKRQQKCQRAHNFGSLLQSGAVITLLLGLLTLFAAIDAQAGTVAQRLHPANLIYQGAFRLPDVFNWGALGLSYSPLGSGGAGSLLITGFQSPSSPEHPFEACWNPDWNCSAFYGQVALPIPVVDPDWQNLPQATLENGMINYDQGLLSTISRENVFVSDIEYVPRRGAQTQDKIYGAAEFWYPEGDFGEDTFPTIWMANLDGSNVKGMFHVGPDETPFHGRKTGSYLFPVPQWYADQYLGGRTLVTGRSRGTPAESGQPVTTHGGSQGPTLFAFHALTSDNPSGNLNALPFLYYRVKFPGCAGPNIGPSSECDYPGFTMCDNWTGGAFVEDGEQRAVMLLGFKGLGANCYGNVECGDPCGNSQGYHCHPYERQVIFYDVHALGEIAQGLRDPWSVLPYEVWRPVEFYLSGATCWNAGGMTFDPDSGRLFMVERGLGEGETNAAVVHVWSVRGSPASDRRLTVTPSGTGTGLVTSTPAGISCGTSCSALFADNTPVRLLAAPGPGSVFTGWSGACSGTGIECELVMSRDRTATAEFSASGATPIIIDHRHVNAAAIPANWISAAKNDVVFIYGHTSHGSQLITGAEYLRDHVDHHRYNFRLAWPLPGPTTPTSLRLGDEDDYYWAWDESTFLDDARRFINANLARPETKVFMWAWCGQMSDDGYSDAVVTTYLNLMRQLEQEYPSVRFVYMTGHTDSLNPDTLARRNAMIREYVRNNGKILYDFAAMESHRPDGSPVANPDDECPWCEAWCAAHPNDCRNLPTTDDQCAHSHGLNCKLKGMALWSLAAHIAGWEPEEQTGALPGVLMLLLDE